MNSSCTQQLLEDFGITPDPGVVAAVEQGRKATLSRVIPLLAAEDRPEEDGLGPAFSGEGR